MSLALSLPLAVVSVTLITMIYIIGLCVIHLSSACKLITSVPVELEAEWLRPPAPPLQLEFKLCSYRLSHAVLERASDVIVNRYASDVVSDDQDICSELGVRADQPDEQPEAATSGTVAFVLIR